MYLSYIQGIKMPLHLPLARAFSEYHGIDNGIINGRANGIANAWQSKQHSQRHSQGYSYSRADGIANVGDNGITNDIPIGIVIDITSITNEMANIIAF